MNEELILPNLDLADWAAWRQRKGCGSVAIVDRDELRAGALLGLVDAAAKYDGSRGIRFRTYAEKRIRGAVLDTLRDYDRVKKHARHEIRQGRRGEVIWFRINKQIIRTVPSFSALPDITAIDDEKRSDLLIAINRLPPRERAVILMYYYDEMTMARIARIFGIKESRISQLCKRARSRLRKALLAEVRECAA